MNILKVNLSILFISMPVCLLADMARDSFVFIDNYRIIGIGLCIIATCFAILWTFLELAVTLLEAFKKKSYNELRSHLKKLLILTAVLCIGGIALVAYRNYCHAKERKKDPPVIRYDPPYDDSGIILDHDPRN